MNNNSDMRSVPLVLAILLCVTSTFAGEIREFNLETTRKLGRELAQVSQRPDRGATTPVKKRAIETAKAALHGRLFKGVEYNYVVLDDPNGSGFLVYALVQSKKEIILGGHFRVTVSANGEKPKRVDALSHTLLRSPPPPKGLEGRKPLIVSMSQIVSDKPLETCVYTSLHDKVIVSVGMVNDNGKVWMFVGDQIFEMTPQLLKQLGIEDESQKKR